MSNEQAGDERFTPTQDEAFIDAQPGPGPTDEESAAAERGAANVDLESVAAHEQEMLARGAHVQGEGQVEPD